MCKRISPCSLSNCQKVLRAIHEGTVADIDFYEQGIERSIALSPDAEWYVAVCTSGTNWQPRPSIERIDREDLEEMLSTARETFMRIFTETTPGLAGHPWVRRWLEGLHEP
jgi:hypothetical protein